MSMPTKSAPAQTKLTRMAVRRPILAMMNHEINVQATLAPTPAWLMVSDMVGDMPAMIKKYVELAMRETPVSCCNVFRTATMRVRLRSVPLEQSANVAASPCGVVSGRKWPESQRCAHQQMRVE